MSLFGLFASKDKVPAAVSESRRAIVPQLNAARVKYSSVQAFEASLATGSVLLFIHGFVNYFASKHRLRRPEYLWAVNVRTFEEVFGRELGTKLILELQRALKEAENPRWIEEGMNAAQYFDKEGIQLLAAFLEGASDKSQLLS